MADALRASILTNPLLEESGQTLDVAELFGIGKAKTRISVISFVGLSSLEAQQQFVNQLAMALFTWIKKNPSIGPTGVTGLFVLDEAKDFLPGGSNSSPCKKSLMRLAAQARKYGLGMVVATQNPKDLDYNAVAQFATQFFGRANSPQVIDFIDTMLQAKGGSGEGVARLQKGQFFVTSSEGLSHPVKVKVPLCLSNHPDGRPLTESEVLDHAKVPLL
jgi:DNA helicase HerA-like ATPase